MRWRTHGKDRRLWLGGEGDTKQKERRRQSKLPFLSANIVTWPALAGDERRSKQAHFVREDAFRALGRLGQNTAIA